MMEGIGRTPAFVLPMVDPLVELYELLLQKPSLLGRIIFIANLWNPETHRYDRGLADRFHSSAASNALARWHQMFFVEWLSQSLEEKERDVKQYWQSLGGSRDQIKPIKDQSEAAIPPLVRDEERKLFLMDLSFIFAVL